MGASEIIDGLRGAIEYDGSVDYLQLAETIRSIQIVSGAILGVLIVIIVTGFTMVIALEIAYINFPIIAEKINDIKRGKNIIGLVLNDARKAINIQCTNNYNQSINLIYIKLKVSSIFIVAFTVAFVIIGSARVIEFVVTIASGIISWLI